MAYSRYYSTWHDYPITTTPVVAAFLQALEDFLVTVTPGISPPAAPATNDALVYNGAAWTNAKIVNANVDPAAAIAYTKIALAASVVNGDISASAAIAYSKLNLAASVTNADIANAAAIAYSKLNLAGSVVNADIATSAAVAISKLADPGSGNVITSAGAGAVAAKPPGFQFTYVEATAAVNLTAITSASANAIVTSGAVTYDGATSVQISFFCPRLSKGTTWTQLVLYDGATELGQLAASIDGSPAESVYVERQLTPSAGSHAYSVRGYVDAGTGAADGGTGAIGAKMPIFIRITKV